MNTEHKQLVEDAAKLLEKHNYRWCNAWNGAYAYAPQDGFFGEIFNPCDPERGDLMKVAEAAGLSLRFGKSEVTIAEEDGGYSIFTFTKGDHQSQALAILRAASAVYKSRGGV